MSPHTCTIKPEAKTAFKKMKPFVCRHHCAPQGAESPLKVQHSSLHRLTGADRRSNMQPASPFIPTARTTFKKTGLHTNVQRQFVKLHSKSSSLGIVWSGLTVAIQGATEHLHTLRSSSLEIRDPHEVCLVLYTSYIKILNVCN